MEGWAIILATLLSPVVAVGVTLWHQGRDRVYQRRLALFTTLMRWRRHPLSVDYVGALNLVPLEFHQDEQVQKRYEALMSVFQDTGWTLSNSDARARLIGQAETRSAELLSAIGSVLSIKIDQLLILKGGYAPQGWADDEATNRTARDALLALVSGDRSFPVEIRKPRDERPQ